MVVTAVKKLLPKTSIGWLTWILVIIGIIIVYRMVSKEIRKARAEKNRSQQLAAEQIVVSDLSFTPAEYSIFAERIFGAFHQFIGYNFDTVEAVLKKLKKASDFYKLIEVYGIRDISPVSWYTQNYGLIEVFEDQLSDGDLDKVSKILKNINVTF
jgi:hypothetical protein